MITDIMNTNKSLSDFGRRKKRVHAMTNDNPKYDYVPDKKQNETYNQYGRKRNRILKVFSIDVEA
jgi:hypothetical protein